MMPLTEDFTYRLDTGPILNTDTASLPFVDITKITGLDSAPFRETIRDHEGVDGGFIDAEFEKGREIVLDGTVYAAAASAESYLDTLKSNFAPVMSPIPFYILSPGAVERLIFVKPRGARYDVDTARRLGITNIQFGLYAEDPRIYAATESLTTIPFGAEATTGFGFDLGFSFGFGGTVVGADGAFVNNLGNRPTPPKFTIFGPVTTPIIIDDTFGHTLQFNITLSASDTLVVDALHRTVLLNGTANRRNVLVDGDWFFLNAGQTFLRYHAVSGATSFMEVRFRSAWR